METSLLRKRKARKPLVIELPIRDGNTQESRRLHVGFILVIELPIRDGNMPTDDSAPANAIMLLNFL